MEYTYKSLFKISIYNSYDRVIKKVTVETEADKEKFLDEWFFHNEDAKYYDMVKTENHKFCCFKN